MKTQNPIVIEEILKKKDLSSCFCKENEKFFNCMTLKVFPVKERCNLIKQYKFCFSCIINDHVLIKCQSNTTCKADGYTKRYYTLIHRSKVTQLGKTSPSVDQNNGKSQSFEISKLPYFKSFLL